MRLVGEVLKLGQGIVVSVKLPVTEAETTQKKVEHMPSIDEQPTHEVLLCKSNACVSVFNNKQLSTSFPSSYERSYSRSCLRLALLLFL